MVVLSKLVSGIYLYRNTFFLFETDVFNKLGEIRMVKPLAEFVASLHKNRVDDRNLQGQCQSSIRGDIIKILVDFYEEGQYGLDIYTR